MIRIVLILLSIFSLLNANLGTNGLHEANKIVLKQFDVDSEFIQNFHTNVADANRYKVRHFLQVLRQGRDFIPMIRKMIKKEKIPSIFLYLAMAESNFSPHATSSQRAAGLWQFVPSTAKKYGMRINEYLDERRDPVKSTKSAIKYIKYLHSHFGKWYLAAMAYNCGESRLRKAIKEAKSDKIGVLLDNDKKYIPRETRNYIRKILSLAVLQTNRKSEVLSKEDITSFDTVKVPPITTLSSVAYSIGVSTRKIKKLNPQFKHYFTPPGRKSYQVHIPHGKKARFKKRFKASKKYNGFDVHVVKKGDSLWKIGKKYGVKYSLIKKLNNLRSKRLRIKQKIIIPVVREEPRIYVVKSGDTLGRISRIFKIKTSAIKRENKIKKYIRPGDKLVIPAKK